jgi:hypothetical protein
LSVLHGEPSHTGHSDRSREWSGWGSRDMDGKAGG